MHWRGGVAGAAPAGGAAPGPWRGPAAPRPWRGPAAPVPARVAARGATIVPMRRLGWTGLALAPLVAVSLVFLLVLRAGEPAPWWRRTLPQEPYRPDRCTWYCHNHGCRHRPALPAFLAGDAGLFGATVRALHGLGGTLAPGRGNVGYGAANLLVFCLLWPAGMYALWVVAVRQRRRLRELRRERGGRGGS
jgi:hypothetical protein